MLEYSPARKVTTADPPSAEITVLLRQWSQGDGQALDRLVPLVYSDLRRMAERHLRKEAANHTLQPTALVNEVFLRLMGQHHLDLQNRAHFFSAAAHLMRRVLVDYARRRDAAKRGIRLERIDMSKLGQKDFVSRLDLDFAAVDEALSKLELHDEGLARLVELRFFFGMSVDETAEILGMAPTTVKREWNTAKAWLLRRLVTDRDLGAARE